jgi:hypothetical protein
MEEVGNLCYEDKSNAGLSPGEICEFEKLFFE